MNTTTYKKRGSFIPNREEWKPVIDYVLQHNQNFSLDKTLDIQLRGECVHIYYRGGKVLEIRKSSSNFDSNYFYLRKEYEIQRTEMKKISKGKIQHNLYTRESAERIFETLKYKRDEMLKNFPGNLEKYFTEAMQVMDNWSEEQSKLAGVQHAERLLQHKISQINRDPDKTDFVVIDIEFSVTSDSQVPYSNPQYGHHPRFDIIAIQPKKGNKLAVIELKKGDSSSGLRDGDFSECKSGVLDHRENFNKTIGSEKGYKAFVEEMNMVLTQKVSLNILPIENIIIPDEIPDFYVAYAGESKEEFREACIKNKLNFIIIKDENSPILDVE